MEEEKNIKRHNLISMIAVIVVVLAVIAYIVITVVLDTTETANMDLSQKVTIGKLTYYIDSTWKSKEDFNEKTTYKYYYPNANTMLMVMISIGGNYGDSSTINNSLDGYLSGMNLNEDDFISKDIEKINDYNYGIVKYYTYSNNTKYEVISYIIPNQNECYVFSFSQKGKLNDKNIKLTENIIENAEIVTETEEEKQARLQKEAKEKAQKEAEEKARKEKEEKERKAKAKQEEKNFKAKCKTYTYQQIARNPEKFKGTNVKLTGEVVQALYGDDSVDLRVNITKQGTYYISYTDTVYVTYDTEEGEDKILEDDIITIYGTSLGEYSYTSTVGVPITLPLIDGKYITIND